MSGDQRQEENGLGTFGISCTFGISSKQKKKAGSTSGDTHHKPKDSMRAGARIEQQFGVAHRGLAFVKFPIPCVFVSLSHSAPFLLAG
jgi:hypothetical protein